MSNLNEATNTARGQGFGPSSVRHSAFEALIRREGTIMTVRRAVRIPMPLFVLAFMFFIHGCTSREINTTWLAHDITIDGIPTDWRGIPITYVEAPNIGLRAVNDSDHLYFYLASPNRNVARQIAVFGLTVWFDSDGGRDREMGIHFPFGTQDFAAMMARWRDRSRSMDMIGAVFRGVATEIEILGPEDSGPLFVGKTDSLGIQLALGEAGGTYVYELKVPLHQSETHPYAVDPAPDKRIGIGFETGEIDREAMMEASRQAMAERGEGEGLGGMGGGPMGGERPGGMPGGGMGPGSAGPGMPKRLEIWATAVLATPDDTTGATSVRE